MTKFYVQWDYASSIGGPWKRGDQVTIEAELAERINTDSPGVLGTKKPRAPRKNRQVKKAETREVSK